MYTVVFLARLAIGHVTLQSLFVRRRLHSSTSHYYLSETTGSIGTYTVSYNVIDLLLSDMDEKKALENHKSIYLQSFCICSWTSNYLCN
jgi:hypothetical protein